MGFRGSPLRPWKRKFLGYRTTTDKKPKLRPAPESVKRLKLKLKELWRRGRGWSLAGHEPDSRSSGNGA